MLEIRCLALLHLPLKRDHMHKETCYPVVGDIVMLFVSALRWMNRTNTHPGAYVTLNISILLPDGYAVNSMLG